MFDKNWRGIVLRSYTALAFYVLAAVTCAPDAIYLATGVDTNPAMWTMLQIWIIALGILGRVVLQTSKGAIRRRIVVAILVLSSVILASQVAAQTTEKATMRVLVPHVMVWEGKENHAYLDRIAKPPVWTICYGETQGVRQGDYRSDAQCKADLMRGLTSYRDALHKYFTPETKRQRLTPSRDAAYVSLAWNVGIRGAGRSTATRRLNAGDIIGGCEALTWWNRAGRRVVRGLVNRRGAEHHLCMVGET
ncbi:lysozyme [Parasedimentitalea huanghaiensis]|uniref:Lysozyme n=1 Tax=Parasedimentitalea huanghaiensis TaxID=2682100 RepID=A0A6L6WGI9_9RHOB|nr:lysozyme [Zongyanglinia huanghaiensis]MVO14802.1 glycoside hydrolase family protein [Zongyanglinia huanghaiensis]